MFFIVTLLGAPMTLMFFPCFFNSCEPFGLREDGKYHVRLGLYTF